MITPAQGYILGMAGNSAMCVALPRKQTTDIYLNGTQIQDNDEADAGWRFMGITGALACGAVYLADKNISNADDRKMLNLNPIATPNAIQSTNHSSRTVVLTTKCCRK